MFLFLVLFCAFLVHFVDSSCCIVCSLNMEHKNILEEVTMKRTDRPSATETERGRASETDRRKSEKKNMEMPLK